MDTTGNVIYKELRNDAACKVVTYTVKTTQTVFSEDTKRNVISSIHEDLKRRFPSEPVNIFEEINHDILSFVAIIGLNNIDGVDLSI